MTGRDRERDVDDLLRDGGGEIGDLYRRLPRYEPPRRLDRAILGEAARAVHSGQAPRRQRWMFGVGSVAGIVLAAGIAWRIGHDAMNHNGAESPASAPIVVPVQPITGSARAKRESLSAQAEAPPVAAGAIQPFAMRQNLRRARRARQRPRARSRPNRRSPCLPTRRRPSHFRMPRGRTP